MLYGYIPQFFIYNRPSHLNNTVEFFIPPFLTVPLKFGLTV